MVIGATMSFELRCNASANIVFLKPDWWYVLTLQGNEVDDFNSWKTRWRQKEIVWLRMISEAFGAFSAKSRYTSLPAHFLYIKMTITYLIRKRRSECMYIKRLFHFVVNLLKRSLEPTAFMRWVVWDWKHSSRLAGSIGYLKCETWVQIPNQTSPTNQDIEKYLFNDFHLKSP